MILKLIPLVLAIILSGCASHNIAIQPMPPEATSMDGAIIAAIGDYVRSGNIDGWPGISGYDSNPIFTTMSAGPITEDILVDASYWAEMKFSVRLSPILSKELQSRNYNQVPLSDVIPRDPLLLTSTNVVTPPEMDTYSIWGKHRYISPFLPVYFNQASNALLIAWTGPSEHGALAMFYLGQKSNKWAVVKGYEIGFM